MYKYTFIVIAVVFLIVVVGMLYFQRAKTPEDKIIGNPVGGQVVSEKTDMTASISYMDTGFTPASLVVKKGTAVTFRNDGSGQTWPASAMHPTHQAYPGSDIKKCGMPGSMAIFDACQGLKSGEGWAFRFDMTGVWKYHDHLHPTIFGSITVE